MNPQDQTQAQPNTQIPSAGLDPRAVALTKAIGLQENGGQAPTGDQSYLTQGQSGERGYYQFTKDTWQNYAGQILGNSNADPTPQNQNQVAYGMVKRWMDEGYNSTQIASMWNAGQGKPYAAQQNVQGTNQYGAKYNVADYASGVNKYYQNQLGDSGTQGGGDISQTTSQPPTQPGQIQVTPVAQQVGKFVGGIATTLFPVLGDIGPGGQKKTDLQKLADLGMTLAWLIPGLGEMGAGARIGANALIGYGIGTLGNIAQGQNIGQALTPQASNVAGAAFGGVGSLALEGLTGLIGKSANLDPQIQTALKSGDISAEQYKAYINAAKAHATDVTAPTPLTMAADRLDQASNMIDKQVSDAGKIIGSTKTGLASTKMPDTTGIANQFKNEVADRYGLNIKANGDVVPIKGRITSLSTADQNRIGNIYQDILSVNKGSARTATDLISKIDDNVNYTRAINNGFDPLENLFMGVRSDVDSSLRSVSPTLADANDTYSTLKSLQTEINKMAGAQNQRGELLMKRVFSGDKSGEVQDLFNKIKQATGIDLVNDAVLAKHAIQTVGDPTQRSLLEQYLRESPNFQGGLWSHILSLAIKGVRKIPSATPEGAGLRLIEGATPVGQGPLAQLFTKGTRQVGGLLSGLMNQNQ